MYYNYCLYFTGYSNNLKPGQWEPLQQEIRLLNERPGLQCPGSSSIPPSGRESHRPPACTVTQRIMLHGDSLLGMPAGCFLTLVTSSHELAAAMLKTSVPFPTSPKHGRLCPAHSTTPPSRTKQRRSPTPCLIA